MGNGSAGYGRRGLLFNAAAFLTALSWPFYGARAQGAAPRLLLLGDSLTAGYGLPANLAFPAKLGAALATAGLKVDVVNAGVSGDTSAGGLARLDWAMGPKAPEYAFVALGANDGLRGLDVGAMEKNLDAIVAKLVARGTKVMLAGMKAPPNMGSDYAAEFAAVYPRVAQRHGAALYPFFLEGVAAIPTLNQADGIHPNAEGVDKIVSLLLPALRRFLAKS
ncbi:MAG: arylesterase [Alphaproteobacteria bacterium]|nr:arylesterase [Alphaproteobacteria bacterium]